MPILIDTVRVANFRSLQNVEVPLAPVTVLVGMNNSGKTSLLRAVNLALGTDRRAVGPDDFHRHQEQDGNIGREVSAEEILIDIRIVPTDSEGRRAQEFPAVWQENEFAAEFINVDARDNESVALRTRIRMDPVRGDYEFKRALLSEWADFSRWQETREKRRLSTRFDHIAAFFIDAQRDVAEDLRIRTSYMGRLLNKVEIPEEARREIEGRLAEINEDIVSRSDVLRHVRESLEALSRTLPSFGSGVEITPVNRRLKDLTRGLGVQFRDSQESSFPLESHGMGTRSWASLLTYQAYVSWLHGEAQRLPNQPFHPVLTLEEPEAHLHPDAQRTVFARLAGGCGQQIISTHSPYIASQAALAELRHFRKPGSATQVRSLDFASLRPDDERKIRREVMRSRGEMLFARAVILFEGETEEQALPAFAREWWGQEPFVKGALFVGVGGDGNYGPFLRVLDALDIPWFIFSDGEPNAVAHVENALSLVDATLPDSRVVVLPGGLGIEGYLINQGYQAELKLAATDAMEPFQNDRHRIDKTGEVNAWTDPQLLEHLKSNKTRLSAYWARTILGAGGPRRFPAAVASLFQAVDAILTPSGGGAP